MDFVRAAEHPYSLTKSLQTKATRLIRLRLGFGYKSPTIIGDFRFDPVGSPSNLDAGAFGSRMFDDVADALLNHSIKSYFIV